MPLNKYKFLFFIIVIVVGCVENESSSNDNGSSETSINNSIANKATGNNDGNKNAGRYLKLADKEWPLVFEDGEYSDALLDEIVEDLDFVYSQFSEYRILPKRPKKNYAVMPYGDQVRFQINDRHVNSNAYLDFHFFNTSFFPDILFDYFGYLVTIDDRSHIVLPAGLINEYKKAIEFKNDHAKEFKRLQEFVYLLNSLGPVENIDISELVNLYYPTPDEKYFLSGSRAKGLQGITFFYPGILKLFVPPEKITNSKEFKSIDFMCQVYYLSEKTPGWLKNAHGYIFNLPLVYVKSRWHILLIEF